MIKSLNLSDDRVKLLVGIALIAVPGSALVAGTYLLVKSLKENKDA